MPHVTQAEARQLVEAVRRRARYMVLLRERMEKAGRTDDPLYPAVVAAHEAMHSLWVHLHYRACGVDRPPEPDGSDGGESAGTNTGASP
jgi:hypothetical protein